MSASFNTDSSLRVCCNTNHGGHIFRDGKKIFLKDVISGAEVQQTETVKQLKEKMLGGQRPRFCSSCFDVEAANGISIRQYYVKKYEEVVERIIDSNDINHFEKTKFLDFSLSNNCNLKCRMCTPGSSYLLKDDFDSLNLSYDAEYSNNAHKLWTYEGVIENLISTESEEISDILFTGGEPLTNQVHLKILQGLVAKGRAPEVSLTYHSNLMVLPDAVVECWKKFKKVDLHLSLEGHEKYNDYIRHHSKWPKIIQNLEKLLAVKDEIKLWLEIHTVFQAYNILIIPEYLSYLKKYDALIPCFPHFIWLDNPSFLSANSLPQDLKLAAVRAIETYLADHLQFYLSSTFSSFNMEKYQILQGCLKRMDMGINDSAKNEFVNYTLKLDKLRNQNVLEVIPQLKDVFGNL